MSNDIKEYRFSCPACGSDMHFDPTGQQMLCDHCGHQEAIDHTHDTAIRELDYALAKTRTLPTRAMETTHSVTCPNCGALINFEGATRARECPFCATRIVIDTGDKHQIRPHAQLPFRETEKSARAAMSAWLGRLWFAPNGLQDYARKGRKMQGIYVPFWTYDADTKTRYTGERGTIYFVSRTVRRNGKTVIVREERVRWSSVSGRVARFFNDVLVLASRSMPQKYTSALSPWPLQKLEPYNPQYIAGFIAEGYTVTLQEGYADARAIMDTTIRNDVRANIGGDRQRIGTLNTTVNGVTFKHILLPVWLAAYKYRGKSYRFVVNGRTGKVRGERPWSALKIAFAVVLALIIAGVAVYVISQNQ